MGRRGRNRSVAVYDFAQEGPDLTRVELTTYSEPATMLDRLKEIGAAWWVRRQTKMALERLRLIFEEPPPSPLKRATIAGYEPPRRRASARTPGWTRRARPVRAPNRLPGPMVLRRAMIAAACALALASGGAFAGCGDEEPGRGRAGPRGPRPRARRHRVQRLHHPPAEHRDPAGPGLLRRAAARPGRDPLRRVHPGLQPHRRGHERPDRLLRGQGQPGQRVPADHAAGRTTRSPTARASSAPDECIPEAGSVAQLGPAAGVAAGVQAPARHDREPAARARDRG